MAVVSTLWRRAKVSLAVTAVRALAPSLPAAAARIMVVTRGFDGADVSSLLADWTGGSITNEQALRGKTRSLRQRADDLVRNNAYAARYVRAAEENILGEHGITLHARVESTRGRLNETLNDTVETAWDTWGETAGVNGESWDDLCTQLVRSWRGGAGEAFLELVNLPKGSRPVPFAVRVLDAELIDEDLWQPRRNGQNAIRAGIEYDAAGQRVRYHVWTTRRGDHTAPRQQRTIPASRVLHLFDPLWPEQSRGVTKFASVMLTLRHLGAMQEATLILNRIAASRGFYWSKERKDASSSWLAEAVKETEHEDAPPPMQVGPGEFGVNPDGWKLDSMDPGQPTEAYDPFTRNLLRQYAAGVGVSYFTVSGDTREANFSSQRLALEPERTGWRIDQQRFIRRIVRPVVREWLTQAVLAQAIRLPIDPARVLRAIHLQPRSFPYINPVDDIKAAAEEYKLYGISLDEIAASRGRWLPDLIRQHAAERQMFADAKLPHPHELAAPRTRRATPAPTRTADRADDAPDPPDAEDDRDDD